MLRFRPNRPGAGGHTVVHTHFAGTASSKQITLTLLALGKRGLKTLWRDHAGMSRIA